MEPIIGHGRRIGGEGIGLSSSSVYRRRPEFCTGYAGTMRLHMFNVIYAYYVLCIYYLVDVFIFIYITLYIHYIR